MPQREFRDERGRSWVVWDVFPTMAERRQARIPIPPDYKERRLNHRVRVPVPAALADGWLVFRTGGERRRLAPIPEQWAAACEAQLRRWCEQAAPARFYYRPVLPTS